MNPVTKFTEYNFVTTKEMNHLKENEKLLLCHTVRTSYGNPSYGFPLYDQNIDDCTTYVQTFGIDDILRMYYYYGNTWVPENSLFILIFVDKTSIVQKLSERQDTPKEIQRRVNHDIVLFGESSQAYSECNLKIHNHIHHSSTCGNGKNNLVDLYIIDNQEYHMSPEYLISNLLSCKVRQSVFKPLSHHPFKFHAWLPPIQ